MSKQARPIIAIPPGGGEEREWRTISAFAVEHRMNVGIISWKLRDGGGSCEIKGWKIRDKFPRIERKHNRKSWSADPADQVKAEAPKPLQKLPEELAQFAGDAGDIRNVTDAKAYLRRKLGDLSTRIDLFTSGTEEAPRGFDPKKILDVYKAIAESWGVTWKHLGDTRSEAEKVMDAVERIIEQPQELFSLTDTEISAIEDAFAGALKAGHLYVDRNIRHLRGEPPPAEESPEGKARAEVLESWLKRLRKVKSLRNLTRIEVPDNITDRRDALVWRGTRLLRYQAYVGRSDFPCRPLLSGNARYVFVFSEIHAKMSIDIHMAKNKAKFHPEKVILYPGTKYGKKNEHVFPGVKYTGILLMYPPRHGKTALLRHYAALTIAENPKKQMGYIHALADVASSFLRNVAALFEPGNADGRRNLSFFPDLELENYDNNAHKMRLCSDTPAKSANLISSSIDSKVAGINLDELIADDIVPRSDVDEPTERERRKQQFSTTWLSRLQGDSFYIVSGYPYHYDDLIWTIRTQAQHAIDTNGREGMMVRKSSRAVGGPTTSPRFKPIFRECYPESKLRSIYRAMRSPDMWAANWMLDPMTDELRIVRRIELYDERPESDPYEHQKFMDRAEIHLSVDPAYAGREHSDRVGLVVVAIGDLELREQTAQGTRITTRTAIRVVMAEEIRATQMELSNVVADIARRRKVNQCHVEVVGGAHAIREFLSALHGIESVIEHKTGPRSKEQRLRQVASMLEAGAADIRAVVQFPGARDEKGTLRIKPSFQKLHDYIINFRATTGHHSLDALTQVLNHLSPRCGIGEGDVSREAARTVKERWAVQQKKRIIEECRAEHRHTEPWKSDRTVMRYAMGGVQ